MGRPPFFNLENHLHKQVTEAEEKYPKRPHNCLYNYYFFLGMFIVMHSTILTFVTVSTIVAKRMPYLHEAYIYQQVTVIFGIRPR